MELAKFINLYINIYKGGLCSSLNNQSNILAKKSKQLSQLCSFKEAKEKDRGSTNKPSMLCMGKTKQRREKVYLFLSQQTTVRRNTIVVVVLFLSLSTDHLTSSPFNAYFALFTQKDTMTLMLLTNHQCIKELRKSLFVERLKEKIYSHNTLENQRDDKNHRNIFLRTWSVW